jgi:XTP/dITP diphosphohydrolase
MPRPIPTRLVIATHNFGKFREFSELLRPYVPDIVFAKELGLPSPEETGKTFAENALLKAKVAASASGNVALADDSGLCITALGGRPGIHSARWATAVARSAEQSRPNLKESNFTVAMRRVQNELDNFSDRSAYFTCILTLCWPDGFSESVEGRVDGTIARERCGSHGHGYDPIFIPLGYEITFAEMSDEEKNRISHRALAIKALAKRFFVRRNALN